MIVLGIMSGTSVDGIDYVWSQISGTKGNISAKFLKHEHRSFSPDLRERLILALKDKSTTHELGLLQHDLGREYAKHYSQLKAPGKTALIGLHGQTVFHKGCIASWQIGEPSYLAKQAKVPVIFNFRAADIAFGGEGAPLAPVFHQTLLKKFSHKPVAFHNLGGISNLTYCYKKSLIAFDTGPASTLMDVWIQEKTKGKKQYDDNGRLAAAGLPHLLTYKKMLSAPYFKKVAPKSCGREEFNLEFIKKNADNTFMALSLEDQLNTLTELTAASIYQAYQALPAMPEKIFFAGGGTGNGFLMRRLKIYFSKTEVLNSTDLGWPASAIEGGAFALLAYLRWKKMTCDLKSVTGGSSSTLLGQICEL
jgi:anhydro-N-acetylmuramic acid kinase